MAAKDEFHPTAKQWAIDFLTYNKYPITAANIRNLIAWSAKEGTTAKYNPLATIDKLPGSSNFNYNNGSPVQNYRSYKDGIIANSKHLQEHGGPIKSALRAGNLSVASFADAVARDGWGSGHFGEAPAGYVSPALAEGTTPIVYDGKIPAGTDPKDVPVAPTPEPAIYGVAPYDPTQQQPADIPTQGGFAAPGSQPIGSAPQRNPQETWQLISQQQFVSPDTQSLLPA